MAGKDYYEILGISRDADAESIKKAYRKLAMKYHPDRNKEDPEAEDRFKKVGEAYAVLSDPEKKSRYDRFGEAGLGGTGGFSSMDIDPFEIFRSFMGGFGFGDIFGGMGGGGRHRGKPRGGDLQVNLALTLEEIADGTTKKIRVSRYNACDECNGTGAKPDSGTRTCTTCNGRGEVRQVSRSILGQMVNITICPTCHGEGQIIEETCSICGGDGRLRGEGPITIHVPAGVQEGNYLTFEGEGHAGKRGGLKGNLIVVFEEKEHEIFERHNDDILLDKQISIPDAVLGTNVEIPTLDGKVSLDIPAGIQSGKILRLRNKGIRHLNSTGRGDQLVRVNVWIPDKISGTTKELFEELSNSEQLAPPDNPDKGFFRKVKDAIFGS